MFKKRYLSACVIAALIALPQFAMAQVPSGSEPVLQVLFVQNGAGVEFGPGMLRLKNVSDSTVWFSDRPQRLAGQVSTRNDFVAKWKGLREGKNAFVNDPPNAVVSVLEAGGANLQDIVVTLRNPRMEGNDLIYDITVLKGTPPKTAGGRFIAGFLQFEEASAITWPRRGDQHCR